MSTEKELPSDKSLLHDCAAGNMQAWQRLLDKYERLVYSIPLNYGLSVDDAADIAQITFTALLNQIDSLRLDSNLGGWLATVARRHAWRVIAKRKRIPTEEFDSESVVALLPGQTNPIARWEMAEWLHSGLLLLNERCRALLTALYLEEQEPSYAEVARRLSLAEGSIGATRARCLQRLKEILQEKK
jgi:RNA polymerase sigma factor (sigma-70 family)